MAVLGSGADVPSPAVNRALYGRILENGVVVSEFAPGAPAAAHNFPRRNRILAALSETVVVVEAARKSGALITVDHALDLGVTVFAVPGSIEAARSSGCNALIADGAGVVLSPAGLVEALGGARAAGKLAPTEARLELSGAEQGVWDLLEDGPLDLDTLATHLRLPPSDVLAALGSLELAGWVEAEPGARYVRQARRSP